MPPNSKELYLRLLRFVVPHWRMFAVSIASLVLLAATEPLLPALMKPLLDGSFVEKDQDSRLLIPGFIILLFLVRGAINYVGDISMHSVAQKVVMDLRAAMFRKFVLLPANYYGQHSSGDLVSKFTFDVTQVSQAATRGLSVLVQDSLALLGLVAYMLYLNWMLTLTVLLIAPIVGLVIIAVSGRLRRMSRLLQQSMGAINQVAQETIECHKVVKIFDGRAYEMDRFHTAINLARKYNMKVITTAANVPIVQLLMAIALAVIVYFASSQAAEGEMTVGDFMAFLTAMTLLVPRIKRIAGINEHLQRGLAAAESIFAVIDQEPEPDHGAIALDRAHGALAFRGVSFAYPHSTANALTDVSISIAPGETVALVGASGSGKSTFVNLIPRFYHLTRGKILVDGVDIEAIILESLRKNIALVTQEVVLFNDTIRNNIAYGALRNLSDQEVRRAAEAAHVMDYVRQMPLGLETMIGDNGVRLSGGQRQRLALARALLKDAPILILDEATSSLDSASERHIQEALETLRQGRTCIIIAHRLSTVENADRIIVLQHGRIVEVGSHRELVKRRGVYSELHRIQFAPAGEDAAPLATAGAG